jgi:FlaA1/EpsC-like NDP-sugar epimerase
MFNPETARYRRFLPPAGGDGEHSRFACAAAGQTILVTGAGGYIGSALAEAIAAAGPAQLLLLDSCELNLIGIARSIEASHSHVPREVILGSVTDAGLLDGVCSRFHPNIVYHAAAFKHVPLLELTPLSAVRNNALGTYTLTKAVLRHGASTLVLVSTDKAANPHSIMGASKRLAELTMAALATAKCKMNAVRLGNVIGSTGSVLPIFLDQIAKHVPITVTHPEVRRYFLSLGDAVEAILTAGAAECSGRILLPELGEPERIADIARFLTAEAADGAGSEIPIRFIGLRPGEKIEEDLLLKAETRDASAGGPLAVILTPSPSPGELHRRMEQLTYLVDSGDLTGVIDMISAMIPEYQPSSVLLAAMGAAGSAAR